jgi:Ni2+-binding GTPase involved in maturation of urease and hydrogenase
MNKHEIDLIKGDPGVGKTQMVEKMAEELIESGEFVEVLDLEDFKDLDRIINKQPRRMMSAPFEWMLTFFFIFSVGVVAHVFFRCF